jgi:hypothetical protein
LLAARAEIIDDGIVHRSRISRRAALPLIAAVAYLTVATAPCPATPADAAASGASHSVVVHSMASHSAASAHSDSPSFAAPCLCGCDHQDSGLGSAKRDDPGLRIATPTLPRAAHAFACEVAQRLPDAPISVASPIPIAA